MSTVPTWRITYPLGDPRRMDEFSSVTDCYVHLAVLAGDPHETVDVVTVERLVDGRWEPYDEVELHPTEAESL